MKRALHITLALAVCSFTLNLHPLWSYTAIPYLVGTSLYEYKSIVEKAKYRINLGTMERSEEIPIPVLGVEKHEIHDTFGALRTGGRNHEGIDIFAPRGTVVVSSTEGIVRRIGYGELGGNYVFITGPGGERYYYAHLDVIDPQLKEGDVISQFALIGRVGTTGNASGTPPHLHFGMYGPRGALNPFDRLKDLYSEV